MATAMTGRTFDYVDSVLEEACVALQLTQTQYDDATKKYKSIGSWLADPASPLYRLHPDIYAQGSMLLRTTNRPWRHVEFDLDVVCQLSSCENFSANQVYSLVAARLQAHGTYRNILELKDRCLRINYAGDFHLDIIPACPAGAAAIWIPDRKLAEWCLSNPLGYAEWFEKRCQQLRKIALDAREAKVRPMPGNVSAEDKYVLQRAVQLLKRHRDVFFDGDTKSACSILLTTLAARAYTGEESLTLALDGILDAIGALIVQTPGIPKVLNPTNSAENFASAWNTQTYPEFVRFIESARMHFNELRRGNGIDVMSKSLGGLIGRPVAERAVLAHARDVEKLRTERSLRASASTGLLTTTAGISIPRNNFYGA